MKNEKTLRCKCAFTGLLFLSLFFSCDILRSSLFEIEDWTPGGDYHPDPSAIEISVLFSRDCDKVRAEQAFSFFEDGRTMKGYFSWQGRRLIFNPASPLEAYRNYLISVGTGAQDTGGLSLERKFEAAFTTRREGNRLSVVSVSPPHNGAITGLRKSFDVFFSDEVTVNSCINHISFSPALIGSWHLEDQGRTAKFTPLDPWRQGSNYRISIAAAFKDSNGRSLGTDFISVFSVAMDGDSEKPFLIGAWAVNPGNRETEIKENESFEEWESFTMLRLDFSEPVEAESIKNRLSSEPYSALTMKNAPGYSNSVFFEFAESPAWDEHFSFRLQSGVRDAAGNESDKEYLFTIRTNGPFSKPPVLVGMRLPMAPGKKDTAEQEILSFSTMSIFDDLPIRAGDDFYPYSVAVETWIEFYFDVAAETEIDAFSLMDLFRVEATNGAISFSPRNIISESFTLDIAEQKWEMYKRLEVRGFLTNTVDSGIVSFLIPHGLLDLRGNKSEKAFRISLLK